MLDGDRISRRKTLKAKLMYNNLKTAEDDLQLLRLEKCMEYVHARVCTEKRKDHPAIRCRSVESLRGSSGLRVLRWMDSHPREIAYPELLLHSAVCWSENCDMRKHAKNSQGRIVSVMREWIKMESVI